MTRSKKRGKSGNWVARQNRDPYVKKARGAGLRARAVFKLEQIDCKYRLIRPASVVIDLGAAPGSWSQYVASRVDGENQVIAVDLLAMESIVKVTFIPGDFTTEAVVEQILTTLDGRLADLVLSDMAPNISGIHSADQARTEELQFAVVEFCRRGLKPGGKLLSKLFEGESASIVRKRLNDSFEQVQSVKPDASRPESREVYLLARGYRGGAGGNTGGRDTL